MKPIEERKEAAKRLKDQYVKNIDFMKKRIKIQNEPNFNRVRDDGISVRVYSRLDIELEEAKLKKCNEVLNL